MSRGKILLYDRRMADDAPDSKKRIIPGSLRIEAAGFMIETFAHNMGKKLELADPDPEHPNEVLDGLRAGAFLSRLSRLAARSLRKR